MANKGIRIGLELEKANAANQVINTDVNGKQYYVNPPTVANQVLQYNGTTLVWNSVAATDNYIGNASSHTAGGDLDMNSTNSVYNIYDLTLADQGGNLIGWTIRDGDISRGDPYDDAFTIASNLYYGGFTKFMQLFSDQYGSGTFSGTPAYTVCVNSSGEFIEDKKIPEQMLAEVAINTTATKFSILPVNCSGGLIMINPPAAPVAGDTFAISDSRSSAGVNVIIINFISAGQLFHGSAANYTIGSSKEFVRFHYVNGTVGWVKE